MIYMYLMKYKRVDIFTDCDSSELRMIFNYQILIKLYVLTLFL